MTNCEEILPAEGDFQIKRKEKEYEGISAVEKGKLW